MQQQKKKEFTLIFLIVGFFFILAASIVAIGSFFMGKSVGIEGSDAIFQYVFGPDATTDTTAEDYTPPPGTTPIPSTPIGPIGEDWDGSTRVTMLVMGLDYRDWESSSSASRSDTMILLTIDPVTKTAGILSIPRDLWANIPGFKPAKINTAYYYGELYNLPGGGPELAMLTVEQTLGVEIDYYAQIEFAAFERFIDLIGGVKIDVPERIKIDPLGPKLPRHLNPGVQVLPGDLTLAYARNRSTGDGDFGRAERQQQVIMGIRNRLVSPGTFKQIMDNASAIYSELSSGINTNLSFDDAIQLALLAVQVKDEDIRRGVINEKYITYGTSPNGLAILIPLPDKIRELRNEIFTTDSVFSPLATGSLQENMALETANLVIYNGTGYGSLEQLTANYFNSLGGNASGGGTAGQTYSGTVIIDYTGNPFTVAFLADMMNVSTYNIRHEYTPGNGIDVVIYLGTDWANNNPIP